MDIQIDSAFLQSLREGDLVARRLADGRSFMTLKVTTVTPNHIICGDWMFLKRTGGEIDDELGWDGYVTGSFITRPTQ